MRHQPNLDGVLPAGAALASLLAAAAVAACSAPGDAASATRTTTPPSASPTPRAASATAVPSATATATGEQRPALPAGFPIMPGSTAAILPDDQTLIARWTVDEVGSAAYDFYVSALPGAGLSIVGLYPAERSALIRFHAPGGSVWQVVAELVGSETRITVQTDRP